ncbi:MAG TPA: hypothetical protein VK905_01915 [Bacillota bacterium]|nr:hypothetical protein [Bacillota bacterium]
MTITGVTIYRQAIGRRRGKPLPVPQMPARIEPKAIGMRDTQGERSFLRAMRMATGIKSANNTCPD